MKIRFILAATLVLNFTATADARPSLTDTIAQLVTPEDSAESFHASLSSQNTISGTQMVQLVAYKKIELAKREMTKIKEQFETLLQDKISILQKTEDSDGVKYRLRVLGFEDIQSARQFCSKLKIENTDCFTVLSSKESLEEPKNEDPEKNIQQHYSVQLGAYKSAVSAKLEMASIQKQFKAFLKDKKSFVNKSKNNSHVLHRLCVTGFSDIIAARTFCSELKMQKHDCFAVVKQ
jgi:hypothetical protein